MFGGMATENNSEVTTLNVPLGILGHVASLLAAMFSWSYSQCRSHLSFMTYNRIFNPSCTACTNNGIETAYSFAKLVYLWFVMGIRIQQTKHIFGHL
jgi:hypothetical protein